MVAKKEKLVTLWSVNNFGTHKEPSPMKYTMQEFFLFCLKRDCASVPFAWYGTRFGSNSSAGHGG